MLAWITKFALLATYAYIHCLFDRCEYMRRRRCIANYCYLREKRQQRRQRQRCHRRRPAAAASRSSPASVGVQGLARPEPIKAESRKHVVNRPHFTATSRRISCYLSLIKINVTLLADLRPAIYNRVSTENSVGISFETWYNSTDFLKEVLRFKQKL